MPNAAGYLFDFPREYLRPAGLVSLLSVWVLVGLFFYLNAYTRRRYFTIWSAAWLFYGTWLSLSFEFQGVSGGPFVLMLEHGSVGIAAILMIWGASVFLKQPIGDRVFGLCCGFVAAWSYLSAFQ